MNIYIHVYVHKKTVMSAAVAGAIAAKKKADEKEIEKREVLKWLSEYDKQKKGIFTRESLQNLLSDIDDKHECTMEALDFVLHGKESINYIKDWELIPEIVSKYQSMHLRKDLFIKYDTDNDGYLDENKLRLFLSDVLEKDISINEARMAILSCKNKENDTRKAEETDVNGLRSGEEIQNAIDMYKEIKKNKDRNLLEVKSGGSCCVIH